jgi:mannonate dehydratase
MKIIAARIIVCSPDRNFVTLKIETDEGVYGLGDATLNGREMAVAAYLSEHVVPCLIGRDPFRTEDIWQYLYRGAYWRRGPVTMTAIAAVDVALWDIKAKALNTPLYNLLGGKSREGVLVYTHANGTDIEETVDSVRRVTECQKAINRTSRQSGDCHPKVAGQQKSILTLFPRCSKNLGSILGPIFIFCTTCTIG